MSCPSLRNVSGMLAAACVALSCAPSRPALELDSTKVEVGHLLELVRARSEKLRSLVGSGSVAFETPQGGGDAFFSLSLRKPDSLLVRLEGPFGIDVGFLFLTRERYVLYNSLENRVFEGTPKAEALRRLIPVELTPEQIVEAFSGIIPLPTRAEEVISYCVEDDRFKLVSACGLDTCTYWVDPASLLIRHYVRHDGGGRVVMEVETGKVTEEEGVFLPKRIRVTFPDSGRQIAVLYSSLSLNDPSPSFAFTVPVDAR
jgi:hypothetical protein